MLLDQNIFKLTAILNCNNISQYYSFYCICCQINADLVRIRHFFKKVYMKLELSETLELETAFISQKHN